jgi:hypothetical protein
MTTKEQLIATMKAENPTLKKGSEEQGYIELSPAEYEATINEWADNFLARQKREADAELAAQAKLDAVEKLIALGIDPKALGL